MSGHRPFADLLAKLPADRRDRIEQEAAQALSELERASAESKFVIYRATSGKYRWRLVGSNGQVLAHSAEEFADRAACLGSIDSLRAASATLAVEEAA